MAVRDVVLFPDGRLKAVCAPVAVRGELAPGIDVAAGVPMAEGVDVEALARDLLDTMRAHRGCVGLAAPQVGELVRMVAVDVGDNPRAVSNHGTMVLVDPVVVESDGSSTMREGCLSIPDFTGDVRRPERVLVEATTVAGERRRYDCDAWEARVLLHELDHLDGRLFLDRVDSPRHVFPRRRRSR
jgi:peptide deformylase